MTRILITGGAGFIGSHLAAHHEQAGDDVWLLDNLSTNGPLVGSVGRIYKADVRDPEAWRHACFDAQPEVIYHLASRASPRDFAAHARDIITTNTLGTLLACEAAERHSSRLILASTSEVYGDPAEHPQREEYTGNVSTIGPRACYDEAKRMAEVIALNSGADVIIARIFNTYGPGMRRDGRLVPAILDALDHDNELEVYGGGVQTRSLCYVSDTVGMLAGLAQLRSLPHGRVYNVGSDEEESVAGIVALAQRLTGGRLHATAAPGLVDEPARRCPALGRLRAATGLWAVVGLEDGLARTLREAGWYAGVPDGEEAAAAGSARGPRERGAGTRRARSRRAGAADG